MSHKVPTSLVGVVVRAGTMDKVVKVRRAKQKFDSVLQKYFVLRPSFLIHDPRNSTRAGDVVRFARWPYYHGSKRVEHIVTEIVSAFGPRLDERPPLPDAEGREQMVREREERVAEKRRQRMERKVEAKKEEEGRKEAEKEERARASTRRKAEKKQADANAVD